MSAIEQVVKDNIGLAYHQLHRFNLAYDEDAVSYAMEALFNAARTYDSNKDIAFSTYAMSCIYNGVQMYIRDLNKKRVATTSIYTFINENGDIWAPSDYFKELSAEESAMAITTSEIYRLSEKVVDTFSKDSITHKCTRAWLDSDFTLKTIELAKLIGCSQASASRAINAFRNKLKEELKNVKP